MPGNDQHHHRAFAVVYNNRASNDQPNRGYHLVPKSNDYLRLGNVDFIRDQWIRFTGRKLKRSSGAYICGDLLF